MQRQFPATPSSPAGWIPLSRSLGLLLSRKRLFGWSLLLFLITAGLTSAGYLVSVELVDRWASGFSPVAPAGESILGLLKYHAWQAGHWLFTVVTRLVAFYLAFLLAYSLSTPGYSYLSLAAEKVQAGVGFADDDGVTVAGFLADILEGGKIALFGVLVTIVALMVNFIPAIGQAAVFLLYTYYSALLFLDYPASRRRWTLGRKLRWLRHHSAAGFRLGILPALISMIPVVNIFAIALLMPLLTVHTTLNFAAIEAAERRPATKP